jgi:hypothetical protein
MDAALLPEIHNFKDLVVWVFPAETVTGFPHRPQSELRAIPAVVRRLFETPAEQASASGASCLICGGLAPVEGRILVAVEGEIGCICAACAAGGLGDDV